MGQQTSVQSMIYLFIKENFDTTNRISKLHNKFSTLNPSSLLTNQLGNKLCVLLTSRIMKTLPTQHHGMLRAKIHLP